MGKIKSLITFAPLIYKGYKEFKKHKGGKKRY